MRGPRKSCPPVCFISGGFGSGSDSGGNSELQTKRRAEALEVDGLPRLGAVRALSEAPNPEIVTASQCILSLQ